MYINLPSRIASGELSEEMKFVVEMLEQSGIISIADVCITLRAFNADNSEYYPADATGRHNMGFTLARPEDTGDCGEQIRKYSWDVPGSTPEPLEEHEHGMRGLCSQPRSDDR